MKKTLLLAGVACLFANQANAYNIKPYVGLDYVHSWLEVESETLADGSNFKPFKDHANAAAFSLGAKFHPNFAVEAFYMQTDKAKKSWNESDLLYSGNSSVKYKAFGADLIGSIPVFCDKLEFLGALGTGYYKLNEKVTLDGENFSHSSHKWGLRLGIGAQYNITEHVSARVMLRNSRVDSYDSLTDVTAGIRVYF